MIKPKIRKVQLAQGQSGRFGSHTCVQGSRTDAAFLDRTALEASPMLSRRGHIPCKGWLGAMTQLLCQAGGGGRTGGRERRRKEGKYFKYV